MKKLFKDSLIGALCGIAGNFLVAIIASYALRLGYFMSYPAALPESVGGELNAVLLTMLLCAALGASTGFAIGVARTRALKPLKRSIGVTLSIAVSVLPALLLTIHLA